MTDKQPTQEQIKLLLTEAEIEALPRYAVTINGEQPKDSDWRLVANDVTKAQLAKCQRLGYRIVTHKKNKMLKYIDLTLVTALMIALPADILYLYIAGGWQESLAVIRYAELALLVIVPVWSLFRLRSYLKGGNLKH